MSIRVNTREYKRSAARLMDVRRWPNPEKFWAGQAKGVMKEVIAFVPPSMGKANIEAKRRGEANVASDIEKLFLAVSPRRADTSVSLAQVHAAARNSKGRVSRNKGRTPALVTRSALSAYLREVKGRVGYLAGGFNAAAAKVGYRPPAWIWRHRSPGSVRLRVSARGIQFRATNAVDYASGVAALESRIQRGIDAQTGKLRRETEYLLARAARASGFRNRR